LRDGFVFGFLIVLLQLLEWVTYVWRESHWAWRLASWAGFLRELLGTGLLCCASFLLGSFAFPGQKDK